MEYYDNYDEEIDETLAMIREYNNDIRKNLEVFHSLPDDALAKRLKLIDMIDTRDGNPLYMIPDGSESPFWGFHPKAVRMVISADDSYLDFRAQHLVLIYGYTEATNYSCVVCIANHKGTVCIGVYAFTDDEA